MSRKHIVFCFLLVSACKSREATKPAMPEIRLTPVEANAARADKTQIGSSGLAGVRTTILYGDPTKPGLYSILLFVPPNTTIPAHSHRDDRMATVVTGVWRFGYGDQFDASALEELPPGSVYSEPGTPAHNHFAQTRNDPVIVHIVGYGPTNTVYVNPADEPRRDTHNP